jgi:hypothetical protein
VSPPDIVTAAPDATVVLARVDPSSPSAVLFEIATTPTDTVVRHVNVLALLNVNVPEPTLVNCDAPLMTPENVVLDVLPTVKVLAHAPDVPSVTDPAPVSEPIVSDKEFTSNVAPDATLIALVSASRSSDPLKRRVPEEIVVVPV